MTSDEIRSHIEMLLADSQVRHRDIELLYETTSKLAITAAELAASAREHSAQLRVDGEHIRALARIAEIHERRLSAVEGEPTP